VPGEGGVGGRPRPSPKRLKCLSGDGSDTTTWPSVYLLCLPALMAYHTVEEGRAMNGGGLQRRTLLMAGVQVPEEPGNAAIQSIYPRTGDARAFYSPACDRRA